MGIPSGGSGDSEGDVLKDGQASHDTWVLGAREEGVLETEIMNEKVNKIQALLDGLMMQGGLILTGSNLILPTHNGDTGVDTIDGLSDGLEDLLTKVG